MECVTLGCSHVKVFENQIVLVDIKSHEALMKLLEYPELGMPPVRSFALHPMTINESQVRSLPLSVQYVLSILGIKIQGKHG